MPIWRVIVLLGQPWQAPWKRIWTTPSPVTSTSSMSPPSACTAGRIRLITPCTLSRVDCGGGVVVLAADMRNLSAGGRRSTPDYRAQCRWRPTFVGVAGSVIGHDAWVLVPLAALREP